MATIRPRTMPGVLELLPRDQIAFQAMLDTIRRGFERFGFVPIETPLMELSEVLLTKTGGETERQVYFVQSTGALAAATPGELPELALRFDLTVPLARYVAEHEHQLTFPFRRYQIQRVYRGERAQRGRFREFYQCDIDVVGKDGLDLAFDAELPAVIDAVFGELAIGEFTIQINNRKLMRGFFAELGLEEAAQMLVLREVDKLDKRGVGPVRDTLLGEGFGLSPAQVDRILELVAVRSENLRDALHKLEGLPAGGELFERGRSELREVLQRVRDFGVPEHRFALNLSIARGLDYYTGTVYETTLDAHPEIGSICSGGRYDDLASQYTKSRLPGVGISIGATRLFSQLREAGLLATAPSSVDVLVARVEESLQAQYFALAGELRAAGINTEVQLESAKLARQLKHADRSGIRFVVMLGGDEQSRGVVAVKDLTLQEQVEIPREQLAQRLHVRIERSRGSHGGAPA